MANNYTNCFEQNDQFYFVRDEDAVHKEELQRVITNMTLVKELSHYAPSTTNVSEIPIGISDYDNSWILLVFKNGFLLVQDTDYVISGSNIILTSPISVNSAVIDFVAIHVIIPESPEWSEDIAVTYYTEDDLLDKYHPVGSYFYTSDETYDPSAALGGTWEEIIDNNEIVHTWHRLA